MCLNKGAKLVEIQNEQENEFLRRLSRDIGGISFLTCLYRGNSLSLYLSLSPSIHLFNHPFIQYIYLLINLSIQFVETVWIGGTDSTEEGRWTWTESTDAMSFTAWGPNQPNNINSQDCLSLYMQYDFTWVNRDCLITYKYICEKNLQ